MSTTAMPYEHLGHALATDYFFVRETFTDGRDITGVGAFT
jgi:hypothetical protein